MNLFSKTFIVLSLFLGISNFSLAQVVLEQNTTQKVDKAQIDFIIEPDSYIPPFYKGGSLFITQADVKILAITDVVIDGEKISADKLIFRWSEGGFLIAEDSGLGKNSITITTGIPIRDLDVSLSILTTKGTSVTSKTKIIPLNQPQIIFYENSPLYGILFNHGFNESFDMGSKEELRLVAKPYYMSFLSDLSVDANYNWKINDKSVRSGNGFNNIILTNNDNSSGSMDLSLSIKNISKIFQSIDANLTVNFEK